MATVTNKDGKIFEFNAPKAMDGQPVWVHNYKKKKRVEGQMVDANEWEWAKVASVKTRYVENENGVFVAYHSYDVVLTRSGGKFGKGVLCLYLSEESIQTEDEY